MKRFIMVVIIAILAAIAYPKVYAQNVKTYIPKNAYSLLEPIRIEADKFAPEIGPWYFASLYEHESCLSLVHSRCMNPTSEYKRYDKTTGALVS